MTKNSRRRNRKKRREEPLNRDDASETSTDKTDTSFENSTPVKSLSTRKELNQSSTSDENDDNSVRKQLKKLIQATNPSEDLQRAYEAVKKEMKDKHERILKLTTLLQNSERKSERRERKLTKVADDRLTKISS